MLTSIFNLVSKRLSTRLISTLETFLDGMQALWTGGGLIPFLAITAAYWAINGLGIAFLATYGFDLAVGPWAGMTVLSILVVGIMVPSGPAMAGNYELFTLKALALFEVAEVVSSAGAAFVACMHLVQFAVQVAPGLVVAWTGGGAGNRGFLSLMRASQAAAGTDEDAETTG